MAERLTFDFALLLVFMETEREREGGRETLILLLLLGFEKDLWNRKEIPRLGAVFCPNPKVHSTDFSRISLDFRVSYLWAHSPFNLPFGSRISQGAHSPKFNYNLFRFLLLWVVKSGDGMDAGVRS